MQDIIDAGIASNPLGEEENENPGSCRAFPRPITIVWEDEETQVNYTPY